MRSTNISPSKVEWVALGGNGYRRERRNVWRNGGGESEEERKWGAGPQCKGPVRCCGAFIGVSLYSCDSALIYIRVLVPFKFNASWVRFFF